MTESSKMVEMIKFFLDNDLDEKLFECCICNKNTERFYIICKPNCIDYSYCKRCIDRVSKERKKCPFTNVEFTYKDVCLDYRKNKDIEKQKQIINNIKTYLDNNKEIKNISIKIDFT